MPATIKDIARRLGVSTSTVSYALNDGPRKVPDSVRQRVLEAAQALDYRPNRLAKSLITRRSNTIGIVPTEAGMNLAATPYFLACFNGIVNAAETAHFDVLVFTRTSRIDASTLVNTLLDGRVDGLIFIAPFEDLDVVRQVWLREAELSVIGCEITEVNSCFLCENTAGVKTAIRYLHELGHRRIAGIHGRATLRDGSERHEAFHAAMSACNLPLRPHFDESGDFTIEGGFAATVRLLSLEEPPTAIFCANDEMAFGALRAARESGVDVPRQLSVIGFDDLGPTAVIVPSLTTVRQPVYEMAYAATLSLVAPDRMPRTEHHRFPTELIVRESTESPSED